MSEYSEKHTVSRLIGAPPGTYHIMLNLFILASYFDMRFGVYSLFEYARLHWLRRGRYFNRVSKKEAISGKRKPIQHIQREAL